MRLTRVLLAMVITIAAPSVVKGSNDLGHIHNYFSSHFAFYHVNLTSYMHTATLWNENTNVAPTDATVSHVDRTSSISDGVNVHDANYGDTTWAAQWQCLSYYAGRCLFSQIQYNLHHITSNTPDYHKGLACHEEGHALGLNHASSSCMITPATGSKQSYSAHDKIIINSKY
jgi:hypothetical protein